MIRAQFLIVVLASLIACSSDDARFRAADYRVLCDADGQTFHVGPTFGDNSVVTRLSNADIDCATRITLDERKALAEIRRQMEAEITASADVESIAGDADEISDNAPVYDLEPYDDGKSLCLRSDPLQAARMGVAACETLPSENHGATVEWTSGDIAAPTTNLSATVGTISALSDDDAIDDVVNGSLGDRDTERR